MAWPYCKATDFSKYVDRRVLVQILSDTDDDIADPTNAGAAEAAIAASTNGNEALKGGAADIDKAVIEARRYDVDALQLLAEVPADGSPDHGVYLRRLNAGLAVRQLQQRRIRATPEAAQMTAFGDWAAAELEAIRMGQGVIPARATPLTAAASEAIKAAGRGAVETTQEAGLPETGKFTTGVTTDLFPSRAFGVTDGNPRDRFNRGYDG
jgi:hypothetical protein